MEMEMEMEIGQNGEFASLATFSEIPFVFNKVNISLRMGGCRAGESPSGVCVPSLDKERSSP